MAFSITTFQSHLSGGGARPSLFSFELSGPPSGGTAGGLGDVSFFCTVSELPGLTITPIERFYYGRTVKIPGDMVFADLTTTIINDEDMKARVQIEKWMAGMNSHETNVRAFSAHMGAEGATAKLHQYGKKPDSVSEQGTTPKLTTIEFVGIFPSTLSEIALSYDTASDIEQYDVTWSYQYWKTV